MRKLIWLAILLPLVAQAGVDKETFAYCQDNPGKKKCAHISEADARFAALESEVANIELTPGPEGPQGPQGLTGDTGPQGDQGPPGNDGTSCTALQGDGSATISCDDGSMASVYDGADGQAGLSAAAAQIQTGLDLTSGLRWLVIDFFNETGSFPFRNEVAGDPLTWSNDFVESATIIPITGVVEVLFRAGAAPQIANQRVYLTPTDPGSGVIYFSCDGDGATDAYLAELVCAFSDLTDNQIYVVRQQIDTVFDLLEQSNAQQAIQDYFNTYGVFPNTNVQAGLASPFDYENRYINSLIVGVNGVITLTFGNNVHREIYSRTLSWTPTNNTGSISWVCDSQDIPNRYLPVLCRS